MRGVAYFERPHMSACLPARLRLLPIAPWRRQAGFTLLEISFVTAVAGALSIGALEMLRFQQMVEQGRHAGERLAVLREGAAAYTRDHGREILAQVPDHQRCAEVNLSSASASVTAAPSAGSSALAGCGLKIDGQSVANAYQPTVAELQALGYVRLTDDLPFTHGDTIVDGHTGTQAVPRWRVSTRCSRHCTPPAGTVANAPKPVFSLMLFNTQPFFPQGRLRYGQAAQLKAAIQAIGPDALIAPPGSSPHASRTLRGAAGQPTPNPLRDAAGGVPGVLATLSYVDTDLSRASAAPTRCGGTSGITCQDGSAPPTASWDFNGKDLDNVANLGVTRDLSAGEYVHAGKRLVAGTPPRPLRAYDQYVFSRAHVRNGPATLEVNGNAYIDRDLTIGPQAASNGWLTRAHLRVSNGHLKTDDGSVIVEGGIGDFDGGNGANSSADIGGIRLPTIRKPGTPCSAANLGLYQEAKSGVMHVVVCRPHRKDNWGNPLPPETRDGIWTLPSDGRSAADIKSVPVSPISSLLSFATAAPAAPVAPVALSAP